MATTLCFEHDACNAWIPSDKYIRKWQNDKIVYRAWPSINISIRNTNDIIPKLRQTTTHNFWGRLLERSKKGYDTYTKLQKRTIWIFSPPCMAHWSLLCWMIWSSFFFSFLFHLSFSSCIALGEMTLLMMGLSTFNVPFIIWNFFVSFVLNELIPPYIMLHVVCKMQ